MRSLLVAGVACIALFAIAGSILVGPAPGAQADTIRLYSSCGAGGPCSAPSFTSTAPADGGVALTIGGASCLAEGYGANCNNEWAFGSVMGGGVHVSGAGDLGTNGSLGVGRVGLAVTGACPSNAAICAATAAGVTLTLPSATQYGTSANSQVELLIVKDESGSGATVVPPAGGTIDASTVSKTLTAYGSLRLYAGATATAWWTY